MWTITEIYCKGGFVYDKETINWKAEGRHGNYQSNRINYLYMY